MNTAAALEMDNLSAGEVGGIFAGLVSLVIAIGGGIRWLIGWNDRRQELREAKLNRWEESLQRREREMREQTEHRLHAVERKLSVVSMISLEMLGELQVLDPASPILAKARLVFNEIYPVEPDVPDELRDLVHRIDSMAKGAGQ